MPINNFNNFDFKQNLCSQNINKLIDENLSFENKPICKIALNFCDCCHNLKKNSNNNLEDDNTKQMYMINNFLQNSTNDVNNHIHQSQQQIISSIHNHINHKKNFINQNEQLNVPNVQNGHQSLALCNENQVRNNSITELNLNNQQNNLNNRLVKSYSSSIFAKPDSNYELSLYKNGNIKNSASYSCITNNLNGTKCNECFQSNDCLINIQNSNIHHHHCYCSNNINNQINCQNNIVCNGQCVITSNATCKANLNNCSNLQPITFKNSNYNCNLKKNSCNCSLLYYNCNNNNGTQLHFTNSNNNLNSNNVSNTSINKLSNSNSITSLTNGNNSVLNRNKLEQSLLETKLRVAQLKKELQSSKSNENQSFKPINQQQKKNQQNHYQNLQYQCSTDEDQVDFEGSTSRESQIRMINNYMQQAVESVYSSQPHLLSANNSRHSSQQQLASGFPSTFSITSSLGQSRNLIKGLSSSSISTDQESLRNSTSSVHLNHLRSINNSNNFCNSNSQIFSSAPSNSSSNKLLTNQISSSDSCASIPNTENIYSNQQIINNLNGQSKSVNNSKNNSSININSSLTLSFNNDSLNCVKPTCNNQAINDTSDNFSNNTLNTNRSPLEQSLAEARQRVIQLKKDLESNIINMANTINNGSNENLNNSFQLQDEINQLKKNENNRLNDSNQLKKVFSEDDYSNLIQLCQNQNLSSNSILNNLTNYSLKNFNSSSNKNDNCPINENHVIYTNLSAILAQKKQQLENQRNENKIEFDLNKNNKQNQLYQKNEAKDTNFTDKNVLEESFNLLNIIDKYYRKSDSSTAVEV